MLHQAIDIDLRVIDLGTDGVDHFAQVMRRNIGRHTDGDTGATVNEKIWESGRENGGLGPGLIVVRDKVDGLLVHVGHEGRAEMSHAGLGITHSRGRIAFDRTEVTLAVDEGLAHRPWLSHVDEGWINHRFTVRMIVTRSVTTNLGTLTVLAIGEKG